MKSITTLIQPQAITHGRVHIDKIRVIGPCTHPPMGKRWFLEEEDDYVPVATSPNQKEIKPGWGEVYYRSKDIQFDGMAHQLEIHCCPPAVLQRHNFFGHDVMLDYIYAVFDQLTQALGLTIADNERAKWQNGQVWLTEVHLTGNFACSPNDILPIIQAIDENNVKGKQRPDETCITLGLTPQRRSKYDQLTVYAKAEQLKSLWKRPGTIRQRILAEAARSIRAEIKLYSMGLEQRGLQYAEHWRDLDVQSLYFEIFQKYQIGSSIQRLLNDDELASLSPAEIKVYLLWQHGQDVQRLFGRTTLYKYAKAIFNKVNVNINSRRRPEKLPRIDIREVFTPENLLPIPDWAHGTEYYHSPTLDNFVA